MTISNKAIKTVPLKEEKEYIDDSQECYKEIWQDDGGHTHENYRSAIVDKKHEALFQTRKKVE